VDCNAAHDVVCDRCAVCAPGTFPNRTCGLGFENDRRDTECLNCSVGTVCFGGIGFASDGSMRRRDQSHPPARDDGAANNDGHQKAKRN
jgi:hypothetical protein